VCALPGWVTRMKWISTYLLLQAEETISVIIPEEQKAFMKGRMMTDHLIDAHQQWKCEEEGLWVAADYSKALILVQWNMLEAILTF